MSMSPPNFLSLFIQRDFMRGKTISWAMAKTGLSFVSPAGQYALFIFFLTSSSESRTEIRLSGTLELIFDPGPCKEGISGVCTQTGGLQFNFGRISRSE